MGRGVPDGGFSGYQSAGQQIDNGQLANMLWGFAPIDGLGRLLYLDTWNNGLGGWFTYQNLGATLPTIVQAGYVGIGHVASGSIFVPPFTLNMYPGPSGGNGNCGVHRYAWLGTTRRLGIEAAVLYGNTVNLQRTPNWSLQINYQPFDTTIPNWNVYLRYSFLQGGWLISTGVTSQLIQAAADTQAGYFMQQIKVVGDWTTGKYARALIGENLIDLSQYPLGRNNIGLTVAAGMAEFIIDARDANDPSVAGQNGFVGYALLTKDEP